MGSQALCCVLLFLSLILPGRGTNVTRLLSASHSDGFGANVTGNHRRLQHSCTLNSCNGVNLMGWIERDLKPWKDKGHISSNDLNAAEKMLHHVEGYIRVAIFRGKLYATHLGKSWGTRDGVFLAAILELLRTEPKALPSQVEFVLSTMDRVQLPISAKRGELIPFALSFARAPGYLDVSIPDPSFYSWPENLIAPYWELLHDSKVVGWKDKANRVFWRGGTARNSGLRETLIHCGKNSKHRFKGSTVSFDMKNAVRNWPKTWAGAMDACQYKFAVFAQGFGYTSAKERILGCGSVPIFLERDNVDTYFGRWLKEGVHFKRLNPETMCEDLDEVIQWIIDHDAEARRIGEASRQFAETILSKEMLNGYIVAMLQEISTLQKHAPILTGMGPPLTADNIGHRFDVASTTSEDHQQKGATKDGHKGGPVDAALAALQHRPCPKDRCSRCCYRSPKTVASTGEDVEAEASEGSWWRRHRNSPFAWDRMQKAREEATLLFPDDPDAAKEHAKELARRYAEEATEESEISTKERETTQKDARAVSSGKHSKRREREEAVEALHDANAAFAVEKGRQKAKTAHWQKHKQKDKETKASTLSLLSGLPSLSIPTVSTKTSRTALLDSESHSSASMPEWKRQRIMSFLRKKRQTETDGK